MNEIHWVEIGGLLTAIAPLYLGIFKLYRQNGNGGHPAGDGGAALRALTEDIDSIQVDMKSLHTSVNSLRADLARAESWMRDLTRLDGEIMRIRDRMHDQGNLVQGLVGRLSDMEDRRS